MSLILNRHGAEPVYRIKDATLNQGAKKAKLVMHSGSERQHTLYSMSVTMALVNHASLLVHA